MPTARTYNFNPSPRSGSYTPEYGGVPGAIEAPDPFADLERLYPNLTGANAQAARNVAAQLRGELSPETRAALQTDAARFGISSGMPGSDLSFRRGAVRGAGLREALQTQGLNNFIGLQTGINRNQILDPQMQADIADRNAVYAAAPDPRANALQLQRTFDQNRGGFGGGGVTGGGRSGGMQIPTNPPAGSDFFANSNPGGTGWAPAEYSGGWQSPIPAGWSYGGQGNDLWNPGPMYGPFQFQGPNIDPNTGYENFDPNWDFGGDSAGSFDPNWDVGTEDYGSFDPNWDYA